MSKVGKEQMYNLLIVDDDFRDRNGIQNFLKNGKWPLNIFVADCGQEAIKILSEEKINIMITDIRIPDMIGTEIAEHAIEMQPNIKIILVSAYKDFQYAQKAIRLGVTAYLLKPYLIEDLGKTIDDVVELCQKECTNIHDENMSSAEIDDDYNISVLTQLQESDITNKTTKTNIFSREGQQIQIVAIKFPCREEWQFKNLKNALKEIFPLPIQVIRIEINQFFLIIDNPNCFLSTINLAERISREMKKRFNTEICLIYSRIVNDILSARNEYATICEAVNRYFFVGKSIVLSTEAITELEKDSNINDASAIQENMHMHIQSKNYLDFLSELQKYLNYLEKSSHFSLLFVKCVFSDLVRKIYSDIKTTAAQTQLQNMIVRVFNIESINDVMPIFEEIISNQDVATHNTKSTRQLIKLVYDIIDKEYMNNISLEYVSGKLFISPSYLSHLFKKETGKSFIEYLRLCRMNKACQLLIKTNLKINQIGKKIGYASSSHFCSIFKDEFGLTPAEYREREIVNDTNKRNN